MLFRHSMIVFPSDRPVSGYIVVLSRQRPIDRKMAPGHILYRVAWFTGCAKTRT
jgi:hypothetical protein